MNKHSPATDAGHFDTSPAESGGSDDQQISLVLFLPVFDSVCTEADHAIGHLRPALIKGTTGNWIARRPYAITFVSALWTEQLMRCYGESKLKTKIENWHSETSNVSQLFSST